MIGIHDRTPRGEEWWVVLTGYVDPINLCDERFFRVQKKAWESFIANIRLSMPHTSPEMEAIHSFVFHETAAAFYAAGLEQGDRMRSEKIRRAIGLPGDGTH